MKTRAKLLVEFSIPSVVRKAPSLAGDIRSSYRPPLFRGHGIAAASYLHGISQTVMDRSRAANDGSRVSLSLSPGDDVVHVSKDALLVDLHVEIDEVPYG